MRTSCEVRNFASQKFRLKPGPAIFQIWESDYFSDSDYSHRSNRDLPIFLLKKLPHRLLLLPKLKSNSGSGSSFSQVFDSGSEKKTQNPAGVGPDPVPPLALVQISEGWYFRSPRLATRYEFNAANNAKVLVKALLNLIIKFNIQEIQVVKNSQDHISSFFSLKIHRQYNKNALR